MYQRRNGQIPLPKVMKMGNRQPLLPKLLGYPNTCLPTCLHIRGSIVLLSPRQTQALVDFVESLVKLLDNYEREVSVETRKCHRAASSRASIVERGSYGRVNNRLY